MSHESPDSRPRFGVYGFGLNSSAFVELLRGGHQIKFRLKGLAKVWQIDITGADRAIAQITEGCARLQTTVYPASGTLRLKLLKVAVRVRITARRVWLSFPRAHPHADMLAAVLANLRREPWRHPS